MPQPAGPHDPSPTASLIHPGNPEEQALSLLGPDLYGRLIRSYTKAQGNVVMNYYDKEISYTRKIKDHDFDRLFIPVERTIITKEISAHWSCYRIPYYEVNNSKNMAIYRQYCQRTEAIKHYVFGGQLAKDRYYDMRAVYGEEIL